MQTTTIDPKLIKWYIGLPPEFQRQLLGDVAGRLHVKASTSLLWRPNPDHANDTPNPQRLALESKADILGYGGAAGGGKSSLALGLAFTQHQRSVIFRRVYPNLKGLIEDSVELIGSDNNYNKTEKTWRVDNRLVEFGAMQYENDKYNWRGRPHDLYVFDEASEFSRSQIEFVIGWLRSTDQRQRCRVVLTFNPPTDEAGNWVIDYFKPWIAYLFPNDYQYPNPAAPGELRWFASLDGKEAEVESGQPFERNGETIKPMSRTFIPAKLADNPHLSNTNYEAVLQSLPEPLRSQVLYGDFAAAAVPNPWQVIPAAWVRLAQKRWIEQEKPTVPLSGVGVDPARGGQDFMAISRRYDNWFAEVDKVPGAEIPTGPIAAEVVRQKLESDTEPGYINIDIIGVGGSPYDSLVEMFANVEPFNGAEASDFRDRSGKMKMRNKRAEYYWRMREALDPVYGDDLGLPPGNEILADLCAATYSVTTAGVQIEKKEEIKRRIGRSPDMGEALMLAHLQGPIVAELDIVNLGAMIG